MTRPPGFTTTRDVRMRVGAYVVEGVLGEGASSIVYAAVDPSGRQVALKVTRAGEQALTARERKKFLDEAAMIRRVQHPSLVGVLDAGELPDGTAYIAMPRMPGRSLVERLRMAPMRFDVTLTLFEQLASALHTLHAAGLVHRDVKPENIFIVEGDGRAILLDLGIAREISGDPSTTTRAGMIRGTPAYMAPERFFGKPATPQTDIYELGVVLYVTLVGELPWHQFDDPTERMRPMPPSQRGVVLPPRLASTLMSALAPQPFDRPRTAIDFAAAVIDGVSPESMRVIAGQHTARDVSVRLAQPASGMTSSTPYSPTQAQSPAQWQVPAQVSSGVVMSAPYSSAVQSAMPKKKSVWPWILVAFAVFGVMGVGSLATWLLISTSATSNATPNATSTPTPTPTSTPTSTSTSSATSSATSTSTPTSTAAAAAPQKAVTRTTPTVAPVVAPVAPVASVAPAAAPCGHPGTLAVAIASAPGVKIGSPRVVGKAQQSWLDAVARAGAANIGACRPSCGSELLKIQLFLQSDGSITIAQQTPNTPGDNDVGRCVASRMKAGAPPHPADGTGQGIVEFPVLLDQK